MALVLAGDLIGDDVFVGVGRRRLDVGVVPVAHVLEVVVRALQHPDSQHSVLEK